MLDAIAAAAMRLCEADSVNILRLDGDATINLVPRGARAPESLRGRRTPLGASTTLAQVIQTRSKVPFADILAEDGDRYAESQRIARLGGYRTMLGVPMLRAGEAVGVIMMSRNTMRPFSPEQVALAETFANQAVIAIENARLFAELQARNREQTEALEREQATAEVLRIISSSPTALQPVLRCARRQRRPPVRGGCGHPRPRRRQRPSHHGPVATGQAVAAQPDPR